MEEKSKPNGFVHIPRTAGGSLVNELVKTDWVILGHDETSPHYMHITDFRKVHPLRDAYLVACVRNPYDRLVSAFHFLKSGGDNEMDQKDAEKYLSKFKTFEEFVMGSFRFIRRNRTTKQIHLRPQTYWASKNNNLLVDRVFKFEELDEFFQFIEQQTPISVNQIGHVHASKHKHWEDYYSQKMKRLVYNTYENDFRLFNYER